MVHFRCHLRDSLPGPCSLGLELFLFSLPTRENHTLLYVWRFWVVSELKHRLLAPGRAVRLRHSLVKEVLKALLILSLRITLGKVSGSVVGSNGMGDWLASQLGVPHCREGDVQDASTTGSWPKLPWIGEGTAV